MWRRQGSYQYMDCATRESLNTKFLLVCIPLKTDALFLDPKFNLILKFIEPGSFKIT